MSKRDEFIAIVNTFKAASPAITDEQRKGLLRQAKQQYGLSFEEARQILKASGLVVGDVVNYFEVLGLAVEEFQNQPDAAIATRVDTAHKELYSASLRAGGLPRPDGKTQEQWRTVLNQARDILKDPQQRREHLATLQPDGEVPDTPSRETTRPIFKFSNGDEATSIPQLAALMEKHPQEAAIALYRGYLEQSLGGAGEMHLAEAARRVASVYAKTPEFGLAAMVQILRGKVKFARGGEASTPQQLARLIDLNWEEAKTLLYGGFLPIWLEYTKQSQLANAAVDVINRSGDETDIGLERLVQKLDPQIGHPIPKVSHTSINFGKVYRKSQKTVRVEIQNTGRGYLYGDIFLAKAMPGLRLSPTSIRGNAVLTVTLDASRLAVNQTHQTALVITTNNGELQVPISCVPVVVEAPSTSSSQDFSFNSPSEKSYANSTSSSQDPATPPPKKESTDKTRAAGWVCAAAISLGILIFILWRATVQNTTPTPPRPESPLPSGDSRQGSVQNTTPTSPRASVPAGMVLIPGGEFQMGSSDSKADTDEKPVHTVYVDAFYMDKYEVTNAQFKAFVDANPRWRKDSIPRAYHDGDYLNHWTGNRYPTGKSNHPVVYVSWYSAMVYAQWVGKRLPTEAEWEKAARGGLVEKKYPWGNVAPNGTQCNFADKNLSEHWDENWGENWSDENADDGYFTIAPIGSYPPNSYGLYDMAGNVYEWCLDAYDAGFYRRSPLRNPLAGEMTLTAVMKNYQTVTTFRVLRGGSWSVSAHGLRVAFRNRKTPTYTSGGSGFRCARDVNP